jgi:Co/Zn/Cd efflux system component
VTKELLVWNGRIAAPTPNKRPAAARAPQPTDTLRPMSAVEHRHGRRVHAHPHSRPHRHVLSPRMSADVAVPAHTLSHDNDHDHGHSHGLVDRSIVRSRAGVRAVALSLAVLGAAALIQAFVFVLSNSVALLADLIHNFGDALTAVPLGIAFFLRSFRGEKLAGLAVVLAIFVSACVALYETIQRFINPEEPTHLWALAIAGVVGFAGNELAAQVRLRAGRRLSSPALVADGNHARVDGFVSLGVVGSAVMVALGVPVADPIIGLAITLVILKITWDSWRTVSTTEPGDGIFFE